MIWHQMPTLIVGKWPQEYINYHPKMPPFSKVYNIHNRCVKTGNIWTHFYSHTHVSGGFCYNQTTLAQSCSCVEPSLAFATRPTSTHQRVM